MMTERGRPFRYANVYLCTNHYHVFCAQIQYHPPAVPAQIHCSVDTTQYNETYVWDEDKMALH